MKQPATAPEISTDLFAAAQLARSGDAMASEPFVFDQDRREVRWGGGRWHLTPSESRVLAMLLATPGRLVTRDQFVTALWPSWDRGPAIDVLKVHVANLRKALPAGAIETSVGSGYRLADGYAESCAACGRVM